MGVKTALADAQIFLISASPPKEVAKSAQLFQPPGSKNFPTALKLSAGAKALAQLLKLLLVQHLSTTFVV